MVGEIHSLTPATRQVETVKEDEHKEKHNGTY